MAFLPNILTWNYQASKTNYQFTGSRRAEEHGKCCHRDSISKIQNTGKVIGQTSSFLQQINHKGVKRLEEEREEILKRLEAILQLQCMKLSLLIIEKQLEKASKITGEIWTLTQYFIIISNYFQWCTCKNSIVIMLP